MSRCKLKEKYNESFRCVLTSRWMCKATFSGCEYLSQYEVQPLPDSYQTTSKEQSHAASYLT